MKRFFFCISVILITCQFASSQNGLKQQISDTLSTIANTEIWVGNVEVRNVNINKRKKIITVTTNETLGYLPFRQETVNQIYNAVKAVLPAEYNRYKVYCRVGQNNIEDLIPNYFRQRNIDTKRQYRHKGNETQALVTNTSKPIKITKGLQDRHIALWQSHGLYYEQSLARWEWQRARLFQTVEDLYTQAYVLPFLVPMLENAGANVLLPRERDTQTNEVIVDNDMQNVASLYNEYNRAAAWETGIESGFAHENDYYLFGENPFASGTYRECLTSNKKEELSSAEWIPDIPETGKYAVYVSYKTVKNSTDKAEYTVYHKGGTTNFEVNQTMYGGTWLYLGHFDFEKGMSAQGKVTLNNYGTGKNTVVTADAVKFGGGMGNIARYPMVADTIAIWADTTLIVADTLGLVSNMSYTAADIATQPDLHSYFNFDSAYFIPDSVYLPEKRRSFAQNAVMIAGKIRKDSIHYIPSPYYLPEISGYPRFTEGARYWLQWAGVPDSIYSRSKGLNDYTDDFQSRGFWVNYISGGSPVSRYENGLNVPLDLALGFHSDAGVTPNDSIIGTLAICTTRNTDKKYFYKNGVSRMAARDMADIVQNQIVSDIRLLHEPEWVCRGLWDKSYSESRVPEVPTMLIELLSHQNFADMRYGLDPQFRFTVCRAVYKGILKYFESVYNREYVVQPLPIEQFNIRFVSENEVELHWLPVDDPLEPTAKAKQYAVYMQVDSTGFDNGFLLNKNRCRFVVEPDHIYSFRITAVNEGGESFPSETLSVCRTSQNKGEVLIVNAFDRISAPVSFMQDTTLAGFINREDAGVPYMADISFVGEQHEFRRAVPWMDDDAPGFGASYGTYETMVIAGNTFDYPKLHGKAIKEAGYSFISCSRKSVESGLVNLNNYRTVDLIFGKQKEIFTGNGKNDPKFKTFTLDLQSKVEDFCNSGGNILISGSQWASDMYHGNDTTGNDRAFVENVLKSRLRTQKASQSGRVKVVQSPMMTFEKSEFSYYNSPNSLSYYVEATDAIEPFDKGGNTVCRYAENNLSAGVVYNNGDNKICTLGFPFETIKEETERNKLMKSILSFFDSVGKQ
ncbi:xanthan lyase [Paludibacter sp. 221]|uniref:golvesin C-terminal-like domain-containing protein n=1 Tax=Paludibacter sp. 221 TaxID=2302939 RepID=UPI0013D3207F|nr:xanthan lyase [Paludibacter sp. 221]NDV46774.1 xanthan lyase [Paludibacter sp. 221]